MRRLRLSTTRKVQIGFFVLLTICMAQISWWIIDEVYTSREVRDDRLAAYEMDLQRAARMQEAQVPGNEILQLFPHLEIDGRSGGVSIRSDKLAEIQDAFSSRINRFGWEGSFFLVFLLLGSLILSRAIKLHSQLQKLEESFLAAVSHELKSPLASIRLATETLTLRKPDAEGSARQLGRILEDVDRLEKMITNLLQTNRVDEGGTLSRPERTDLRDSVERILEEVGPRLQEQKVALEFESSDENYPIQADPDWLHSVLINLIDNAVKATSGNEQAEIQLTLSRKNGRATLRVVDNGIGFASRESERIFEKFYRLGNELRRTSPGSGLGLYLVRRLVELQGGSVKAHSAGPGTGAEFHVSWPLAK